MKKRLLRDAIKQIVITTDEMKVTFWLSADEREAALPSPPPGAGAEGAEVISFRSSSKGATHRNSWVGRSLIVSNGSQTTTSPETGQVYKIIKLSSAEAAEFSKIIAEKYKNGLSLNDISKQTGKAKNTIRDALIRAGIELRSRAPLSTCRAKIEKAKGQIRPFYGFCYFQGRIVPDPHEHDTLLLIHKLWKSGLNPNSIAVQLNSRRLPARSAKAWTRNSVVNVIDRFRSNQISIKGGTYELR